MSHSEEATVTSKGQVTIPKRIRDRLEIESGTRLAFVLEDDGSVRVYPKKEPTERLEEVKERLADREVDATRLREQSRGEWGSDRDGP